MHRRRQFIEGKVTRIDDTDAVTRQEPQFAICGLGDSRAVAATDRTAQHSIRTIENRGPNAPLGIDDPRVQLRPLDAHQATGHVQPKRVVVVLPSPVNAIAGQSVLAGQRGDATAFHAAEPALGGRPECTVLVDLKIDDDAFT